MILHQDILFIIIKYISDYKILSNLRKTNKLLKKIIYNSCTVDVKYIKNPLILHNIFKHPNIYIDYYNDFDIQELNNIKHNILEINLSKNKNITDISQFTRLNILDLRYNNLITKIQLINITSLNINYNTTITDEELSKLTNIKILHLHYNEIITNKSLDKLIHLKELYIPNNTNIKYINQNLHHLDISGSSLITNNNVEKLTNLISLCLAHNVLIHDSALSKLTKLESLNLNNNYNITDHSLVNLINLKRLIIDKNTNITHEAVSKLINLNWISMAFNNKIKIQDLIHLNKLKYVSLSEDASYYDSKYINMLSKKGVKII